MSTKKRKSPEFWVYLSDCDNCCEQGLKGPFISMKEVRRFCLIYIIDECDGYGGEVEFSVFKRPVTKFEVKGNETNFTLKEVSP